MFQLIAADPPLGPERRDHPLKGDWAGYRECHIGGDFLLIYRLNESAGKSGEIVFTRAGTTPSCLGSDTTECRNTSRITPRRVVSAKLLKAMFQ